MKIAGGAPGDSDASASGTLSDTRILTPKVFGIGWSINLAAVARKRGLLQ